MITIAIIGLVIFGVIGGAIMCDTMMVDGCLEAVVGFALGAFGALMFIGAYVGIASIMAIIIIGNI